ncbi:MAG TPA: glycine oxidase ThiO [Pseudomonadales bacterium]|nr:glycine oxidase ThiO [Pseudomonadales bacterium]
MSDFVVIGGGVIGLLLSRHLLQADASVTLLEAGQCGREASWAGGGIVSPLYPWRYVPAVTALASQAQRLFPALCNELLAETGIDAEYRQTGLLMLDAPDATQALQWAQQHRITMQAIAAENLLQYEKSLAETFNSGVWMPDIANVRNPRLLQALQISLQSNKQFFLREFSPVKSLQKNMAVLESGEQIAGGNIVVCAGAWAGQLLQKNGIDIPVAPVLGQMLLYRLPVNHLRTIVLHEGRYAIPRADGHVLVGSTLEQRGFAKTITVEACNDLRAAAEKMLPGLKNIKPLRQWAGLRPAAPDGVPLMGKVPGYDNIWLCAGHFRNGLVLSPASAQLMADLLLACSPSLDPVPYAVTNTRPF